MGSALRAFGRTLGAMRFSVVGVFSSCNELRFNVRVDVEIGDFDFSELAKSFWCERGVNE